MQFIFSTIQITEAEHTFIFQELQERRRISGDLILATQCLEPVLEAFLRLRVTVPERVSWR